MHPRTLIRITGNGIERIFISRYGFESYLDGQLIRMGYVENADSDIQALLDEVFEEVQT